jgi:hypothetical protein
VELGQYLAEGTAIILSTRELDGDFRQIWALPGTGGRDVARRFKTLRAAGDAFFNYRLADIKFAVGFSGCRFAYFPAEDSDFERVLALAIENIRGVTEQMRAAYVSDMIAMHLLAEEDVAEKPIRKVTLKGYETPGVEGIEVTIEPFDAVFFWPTEEAMRRRRRRDKVKIAADQKKCSQLALKFGKGAIKTLDTSENTRGVAVDPTKCHVVSGEMVFLADYDRGKGYTFRFTIRDMPKHYVQAAFYDTHGLDNKTVSSNMFYLVATAYAVPNVVHGHALTAINLVDPRTQWRRTFVERSSKVLDIPRSIVNAVNLNFVLIVGDKGTGKSTMTKIWHQVAIEMCDNAPEISDPEMYGFPLPPGTKVVEGLSTFLCSPLLLQSDIDNLAMHGIHAGRDPMDMIQVWDSDKYGDELYVDADKRGWTMNDRIDTFPEDDIAARMALVETLLEGEKFKQAEAIRAWMARTPCAPHVVHLHTNKEAGAFVTTQPTTLIRISTAIDPTTAVAARDKKLGSLALQAIYTQDCVGFALSAKEFNDVFVGLLERRYGWHERVKPRAELTRLPPRIVDLRCSDVKKAYPLYEEDDEEIRYQLSRTPKCECPAYFPVFDSGDHIAHFRHPRCSEIVNMHTAKGP